MSGRIRRSIASHPYAKAAAEVQELAAVREELVVNDAELDRKIIALAESMGVGPTAQAK